MSLLVDFCEMEHLAMLLDSSSDNPDATKLDQVLRILVGARWVEEDSSSTNLANAKISLIENIGIGKVGCSYVILKSVGCIGFIVENTRPQTFLQTDRFLFLPLEKKVLDGLFGAAVAKGLMSEAEVELITKKFYRQNKMYPEYGCCEYTSNEMEADEYELLKRRVRDEVEGTNTADKYLDDREADRRAKIMQQILMGARANSKHGGF